jgi:hypothetical protein
MKIKTSDNQSDCLTKFKSITDLNKDADSFMSNAEVSTSNSNKKSSIKNPSLLTMFDLNKDYILKNIINLLFET